MKKMPKIWEIKVSNHLIIFVVREFKLSHFNQSRGNGPIKASYLSDEMVINVPLDVRGEDDVDFGYQEVFKFSLEDFEDETLKILSMGVFEGEKDSEEIYEVLLV